MGTHSGQAAELAQVLALLEARAHDPARPLALALESLEGLADLLRRIVWTDEASAAGGAHSELSALLAGPLGATVNDARLRAGLRLIELLGHLTAEPDPARIAALQRAQLLSTAIGAPHSTWP